ncbi:MAG: T9SS type A sorting domain-containing protein [Chlorobi bacterium]|nr:T9SS type A sorting domain-containing protein [Chlorobiota bacterium]
MENINYNGCPSADTVEITYDFFVVDAGTDDVTCIDSYTLHANDPTPGTGKWRVTGGTGTFADTSQNITEVTGMVTGDNTFEWTITHGACIYSDYVTITRNTPSVASAGPDKETCNGEVTMAAVNPAVGSGSWSIVSGSGIFTSSLLNNTTVTNIGLNDNIYRWTVEFASCSNYDDVRVTNNYVSANAGADQIVCGTTSTLNANQPQSGESGKWEVIAGTSTVTNTALYNSGVIGLVSGFNNFRWTLTKGFCSDYDDISVTNNLYEANASVSGTSDVCDDFASVIGNTPPSGGYGYWSVSAGTGTFDNSLDNSTIVRNLSLGTNLIRWTLNKDGCEDFDEIQINRNSVFADAGTDQNACVNHTFLSGNQVSGNLSGSWTRTSGSGSISNLTLYNTEVTNLTSGINTFKWTISGNGCTDSDEMQVINNEFIASAGSNKEICESYTSLTASDPAPGYGQWSVISGSGSFSAPSNFNTDVTGIPDISINIYRWTVFKNGCSDYDDVTITNNAVAADAGNDFSVCSPWAALSGNNPSPGTGVWTIQVGGGNLADENSPTSFISNLSLNDNIIRWTVTNNTCVNYDEVTITNNTVTATAGGDQAVCKDYTNLSGQQPTNEGTGLWELVSGNGNFANNTLYNTQVTDLSSGFNTFRWTIFNNGCNSGGDEVTINNKSFQAFAGENQTLPQFVTSTQMAATLPSGGTGTWQLLSGGGDVLNANAPSTSVTNLISGINQFQWTVLYNGCQSYDVVDITAVDFQPNAGIDKIICSDSLKLNAQDMGGTPQFWSVIEGTGIFDNSTDPTTWVRNISVGINRYRWSVTITGATAYDDIIITSINANAGPDQTICENYTTLNGNFPLGSINANWALVAGNANIISPTLYNTQVTNIGGGNNYFLWTVHAPNCYASDYVNVSYEYVSANAGSNQIICDNYTSMNAENPAAGTNGIWSVVSGNGIFENPSVYNTNLTNINPGNNIYKWTVYKPHCYAEDDINILNDELTADAGEDQTVFSSQIYLNAVQPSNGVGLWSVISGYGTFYNENNSSTFVSNLDIGNNYFRWTVTNNNNCYDYDDVIITYDNTGSVSNTDNIFKIFPNPTNGIIHIKTNKLFNYDIEVHNLIGKTIYKQNNNNTNNGIIDLSDSPAGIYFIKLSTRNKYYTIKVVKK